MSTHHGVIRRRFTTASLNFLLRRCLESRNISSSLISGRGSFQFSEQTISQTLPWNSKEFRDEQQRRFAHEAPLASGSYNEPSDGSARRSNWVQIRGIPPLSSLEDILLGVWRVLEAELSKETESDETTNLGNPQDLILSARVILSPFGRPTGWKIQFIDHTVAQVFLRNTKRSPLFCAWKATEVKEWNPRKKKDDGLEVSDSWIRVENCYDGMTVDHLRHLLRRYELTRDGPAVRKWECDEVQLATFLVHFADPSWARAAVRELQGLVIKGSALHLIQYPRCI